VRAQNLVLQVEVARSEVAKCRGCIFVFGGSEVRGDTWQNHKVGPGSRPADTRHTFGGVNTPLTSRVSGTREIRERKFEPSTREVASSENERRKVKYRLSGVRERKVPRLDL
jgi:hypothetical protein